MLATGALFRSDCVRTQNKEALLHLRWLVHEPSDVRTTVTNENRRAPIGPIES